MVRPAKTRFATAFLTLDRFRQQKKNLKNMVTSEAWTKSKFAKETGGKNVANILMMPSFWNEIVYACKVAAPLVTVLRLVDGESKPAMGYIYEEMEKAKEKIAKNFENKTDRYDEIFEIIDKRWNCQLHRPLHAAGYYLNPALYYESADRIEQDAEVKDGFLACVSRLARDDKEDDAITAELAMYTGAQGIFGTPSAIRQRTKFAPAQWWKQYGTSTPNLRRFAIKVLSLTCSSSGCERNWSVFEHLHSKKRNRLNQKKLNDLVYVKYNRALRRRYDCRDTIDPIILDDASVDDPNMLLLEALDEDTSVFEDDNLSWGVVAEVMGVNEAPYSTRKSQAANRGGKRGSTSTAKSKGKAPMARTEEDEDEFNFNEESEEENDASAYKDCDEEEDDDSDDEDEVY